MNPDVRYSSRRVAGKRHLGVCCLILRFFRLKRKAHPSATGVPVAEIYGVVTFYSFFSLKPKGKFVIGCCLGTACYVKGAQAVIDKFVEVLGIKPGETTEDGMFTIDALRCLGACGIAPAVTINGKIYPRMSADKVQGIINDYKKQGGVQ